MKTNYQYEQLIREKLERLPSADIDDLWSKMEKVLDVEMPVERSKRPSPVFLLSSSGITMLIAAAIFTVFIINRSITASPKDVIPTNSEAVNTNHSKNQNSTLNTHTIDNNSTLLTNGNNINTGDNTNATQMEQNAFTPFVPAKRNNSFHQTDLSNALNNSTEIHASDYDNMSYSAPHKNTLDLLQGRDWNTEFEMITDKKAVATPFLSQAKTYNRKSSWMDKIVAGVSFNYNVPVGNQEATSFNYNNKSTALYDYLPSVFVQYHFSKKFSLEAEVQLVSPQNVAPNTILYSKSAFLYPTSQDEKTEEVVTLNKLYYMNVPVSVHFTPTPHFTIGAGVQLSQLKQMILTDDQYYSVKRQGQWNTSLTSEETTVRSAPTANEKSNMTSPVDSVAAGFKRTDLRLNLEAGYNVGRFNIGARYTKGLNNAYDDKISPNALPTAKNQSVQLFVKINLFDKRKF